MGSSGLVEIDKARSGHDQREHRWPGRALVIMGSSGHLKIHKPRSAHDHREYGWQGGRSW
jgi:hypothetical protein